MFRTLALSGLIAIGIAAAPVATPQARAADPHDITGGAIALGILGAIVVNEQNKRKARQQPTYHAPEPERFHQRLGYTHKHVYHGKHRHDNHVRKHKRKHKRHANTHNNPPRKCLRQRWTNQGWVTYYSNRCLRKHGY